MPFTNSEHYASLLDRASMAIAEGEPEYRIEVSDSQERERLRMALHSRIRLERKKMQKQCSPDDPAWGISPWENLRICVDGPRAIVFKGPIKFTEPKKSPDAP